MRSYARSAWRHRAARASSSITARSVERPGIGSTSHSRRKPSMAENGPARAVAAILPNGVVAPVQPFALIGAYLPHWSAKHLGHPARGLQNAQ